MLQHHIIYKKGTVMDYTITVYTQKNCPWCSWLKQWLHEGQISFMEKNITESKDSLKEFQTLGVDGVPYTVVKKDGEVLGTVRGFDVLKFGQIFANLSA